MPDDLRVVLERVREGAYIVDASRRISFWNGAAEQLSGFPSADVLGCRCADNILTHVDGSGRNLCAKGCPLTEAMHSGRPHEADLFMHHRSGHRVPVAVRVAPLHDSAGRVCGAIELFSAPSSESDIRARMAELERLSLLDELTRLPNRRQVRAELAARLSQYRATGVPFGVLFIDIDAFKRFNDLHSHAVGDLAIQTVAHAIQASARPFDVVGRWGGDEFVGVFPNVTPATLAAIGDRLTMLVRNSRVEAPTGQLDITVSAGGAIVTPDDSAVSILQRADAALYASKRRGRDQATIDTPAAPIHPESSAC